MLITESHHLIDLPSGGSICKLIGPTVGSVHGEVMRLLEAVKKSTHRIWYRIEKGLEPTKAIY